MSQAIQKKKIRDFRRRRISLRNEYRQQLVLRNNLEKRLNKQLATLFRKFVRVQLFLYKEFGIYQETTAARTLNEDFFPLMLSHYRKIFKAMYKFDEDKYRENIKQDTLVFGRNFNYEKLVAEYFRSKALILSGISFSMSNRIKNLINQLEADGISTTEIARQIEAKFSGITIARAGTIARTETHNAASFANHSYHTTVSNDLGVKMQKQWLSAQDGRVRPAHAAANGQVVDIDQDFIVDGLPMEYAGDPKGGAANVINCRCVIVYGEQGDL